MALLANNCNCPCDDCHCLDYKDGDYWLELYMAWDSTYLGGKYFGLTRDATYENIWKSPSGNLIAALYMVSGRRPRVLMQGSATLTGTTVSSFTPDSFLEENIPDRGILFECRDSIAITIRDVVPGQTLTIRGRTYTAAASADVENRLFSSSGNDEDDAESLAECLVNDGLNAYSVGDGRIYLPDLTIATTGAEVSLSNYESIKPVVGPEFSVQLNIGTWVEGTVLVINGVSFYAAHATDTENYEFDVSSGTPTQIATEVTNCLNEKADETGVLAYQYPTTLGASRIALVPEDGIVVSYHQEGPSITLVGVQSGDQVEVNGVTFTAATGPGTGTGATAIRQFNISGSDDSDALDLTSALNNGVYGIYPTGGQATRIGNTIYFSPRNSSSSIPTVNTLAPSRIVYNEFSTRALGGDPITCGRNQGIGTLYSYIARKAVITLTDVLPGFYINFGSVQYTAAESNSYSDKEFAVGETDEETAQSLYDILSDPTHGLQYPWLNINGNRVIVWSYVFYGLSPRYIHIKDMPWTLLARGPQNFQGFPVLGSIAAGQVFVDGIAPPESGGTALVPRTPPSDLFCRGFSAPSYIELLFDGWPNQYGTGYYAGDYRLGNFNNEPISLPLRNGPNGTIGVDGRRKYFYGSTGVPILSTTEPTTDERCVCSATYNTNPYPSSTVWFQILATVSVANTIAGPSSFSSRTSDPARSGVAWTSTSIGGVSYWVNSGVVTQWLKAVSPFGIPLIPPNAALTSVSITVSKHSPSAGVVDDAVHITSGGTVHTAVNKAKVGNWPTSPTNFTYEWSQADLAGFLGSNVGATFGFVFASTSSGPQARVIIGQITITWEHDGTANRVQIDINRRTLSLDITSSTEGNGVGYCSNGYSSGAEYVYRYVSCFDRFDDLFRSAHWVGMAAGNGINASPLVLNTQAYGRATNGFSGLASLDEHENLPVHMGRLLRVTV